MSVGAFQQAGTLMALSDLSLQYKAPLRAGDLFYITTAVAQVTGDADGKGSAWCCKCISGSIWDSYAGFCQSPLSS